MNMARSFNVSVGRERFQIRAGEILLDAALRQGIELAHDCRVGHCGTCTLRVRDGLTIGGETGEHGCVRACQAQVFSDMAVEPIQTPAPSRVWSEICSLRKLADGIVEVGLKPRSRFDWLPGQYCHLTFRGFPARTFSPTACLSTGQFDKVLKFQIKQVRTGSVTPHLGGRIKLGHRVMIEGPYGTSYLRPGQSRRLVLVASGTGFAPIWAVAAAALKEDRERSIAVVYGTRDPRSFYAQNALRLLARHPNVRFTIAFENLPENSKIFAEGTPADNLPNLAGTDIVYAAGSPKMVASVAASARKAGCEFYADPFETSAGASLGQTLRSWLQSFSLAPRAA
jgi:CDP-4-dehydro-6-deoxyglucose reductase, E3